MGARTLDIQLRDPFFHGDTCLDPLTNRAGDKVKVTGFGLAESIDDKVFGAPAFLSPEQAEGKPVDQRSNIYSLGALLYYVITGEPPVVMLMMQSERCLMTFRNGANSSGDWSGRPF